MAVSQKIVRHAEGVEKHKVMHSIHVAVNPNMIFGELASIKVSMLP